MTEIAANDVRRLDPVILARIINAVNHDDNTEDQMSKSKNGRSAASQERHDQRVKSYVPVLTYLPSSTPALVGMGKVHAAATKREEKK